MTEQVKLRWLYFSCAIFIALNSLFIYHELYWLYFAPVAIGLVLLSLLSIDKLLLLIVFVTPFSLDLKEADLGAAVSIPAEPLTIGAMVLFLFKVIAEGSFDTRIFRHPVSVSIIFYLFWMTVTSATSELPGVSFKFLASKLWFIITFYFLATHIFRRQQNIPLFLWMYSISMLGVIGYTIYNHYTWGFEKDPAHWVMTPFYNDHTHYGALLAMFIPFVIGYALFNRYGLFIRVILFANAAIYITALILSNSRASWLSIVVALGVLFIFVFRVRWYVIAGATAIALVFFMINFTEIVMKLEKNKQDSSGNFTEHVQSMSNISTDASNLERLLRWNCAIRMYEERPVVGWGPGTYSFVYAPFQKSYEKTIISTNFGDGGNAHSEYLGPLSEQGVPGLFSVLMIIFTTAVTAVRVIKSKAPKRVRQLCMMVFLGLVTYWVHGILNNFLDTEKASIPYWGFIAIVVAMDVYYRGKKEDVPASPVPSEKIF